MIYLVTHTTKFRYSDPIRENFMEVYLQPRSDEFQRCLDFQLAVRPTACTFRFHDHLDNVVHHFDVAGSHKELTIVSDSVVDVYLPRALPESLDFQDWDKIDALAGKSEYWEMLEPSQFTRPTELLHALARELDIVRQSDPMTTLLHLNSAIHNAFVYEAETTEVDSPIDEAIQQRRGVCQDFSHVMLAMARSILKIPCRYVSGYLFHRTDDQSADDATHAWLEVFLPDLGWVGFDPTNNMMVGERHIRVAVGRDYADVPPTRGVFKGNAEGSKLDVSVQVTRSDGPPPVMKQAPMPAWSQDEDDGYLEPQVAQQQQQ